MKKILLVVLIIAVLLIVAGAAWYFMRPKEEPKVEVRPPQPTVDLSEHNPPKQDFPVVLIDLQVQNNSEQLGSARLEGMPGDKTKVTIKLTGGNYGSQPAHIHTGSCPTPGAVRYPLTNVEEGMSETIVDVNLEKMVTSGEAFAINIHKSAQESSVYTACGDLPRPL